VVLEAAGKDALSGSKQSGGHRIARQGFDWLAVKFKSYYVRRFAHVDSSGKKEF
jgi:hypothetical protein